MNSLAILIGALFGFVTNFWPLWLILGFFYPPMFAVGFIAAVVFLFTQHEEKQDPLDIKGDLMELAAGIVVFGIIAFLIYQFLL